MPHDGQRLIAALSLWQDRATATDNVRTGIFLAGQWFLRYADRHADRTHPGNEVKLGWRTGV